MRDAYLCVNPACKAWRWVDSAKERGERACKKCGTPFSLNSIKAYPPLADGGEGKGKGQAKGGGGAQVQGGKGSGRTGQKSVGLQPQPHLQGGGQGKGAGNPKGAAPQRKPAAAKSQATCACALWAASPRGGAGR